MTDGELAHWRGKRVALGLSGGVDSSVAALLLLRAGADVRAFFMSNWRDDDDGDGVDNGDGGDGGDGDDNGNGKGKNGCNDGPDLASAAAAADILGIPLDAVSFADEYRRLVFAPFLAELRRGRTPNPDVLCNSHIKFDAFLRYAREDGCEAVATGHYAGILRPEASGGGAQKLRLQKGEDSAKDQSYFLHRLAQPQLARAIFPLARLHKADVRAMAKAAGLANWSRKDSAGICFIGKRRFAEFIRRYLPDNPGEIQTPEGETVGAHSGLHLYTIGQRRGLGIGGGEPWFVCGKRLRENVLQVSRGDAPALFRNEIRISDAHWIAEIPPPTNWVFAARLRHGQEPASCTLSSATNENATILFPLRQRAPAPGQSAVLYDGNTCLGGGIIEPPPAVE